ncbi:MAG: efflux RND transporter permease subunit [Acidiferrobacterales bacterium]
MHNSGGLAAWAIRYPVSTIMLTLTIVVLGVFGLGRLAVDLLPDLIYPQIRVRILEAGVSASIMEQKVTRQLEEQLAITEDAIRVESRTAEGSSTVDLHFDYGKDIDAALRDASTRLDRAKRFLPDTIQPPIIYKMDPSQIPVMEYVVSSNLRSPVEMRTWVDDVFSKRLLNLPGVAAVEVGGGVEREIQILVDQRRLAGLGLSIDNLIDAIQKGNEDVSAGRMRFAGQEYGGRATGRLGSIEAIAALPIRLSAGDSVPLSDVARVIDAQKDQRIRIRFNGTEGVKMSVQKQPTANTVDVADRVQARLAWMAASDLIPEDIVISNVADQSIYVRRSLNNASMAAFSGAILAMIVVYLFIGNIRGTLIIGTAIPISILVTFIIMALGGLTLNIMTLGGLALGVGMLIDNTIVMLENIARHRKEGSNPDVLGAATDAAGEVTSAIVASTTTNLAAVLPFLFVSGLVGLLFRELIFTISAAIVASLLVAVTLVPSLAARMRNETHGKLHDTVDGYVKIARIRYIALLARILERPQAVIAGAVILLLVSLPMFISEKQEFLPKMDEGRISINILTDAGTSLDSMDQIITRIEKMVWGLGDVKSLYTLVGGHIFGRTERETPNRSSLTVQLVSKGQRDLSSQQWVKKFYQALAKAQLAGIKVRARPRGIRGLRTSRTEDDLSIRVQGPELSTLAEIGDTIVGLLKGMEGLRNLKHSSEDIRQEFAIEVDRQRATELGIDVVNVGRALRIALDGLVVSDFVEGDRSYDIRVRLPQEDISSPMALGGLLLFGELKGRRAVYLNDVARVKLVPVPASILRENQRRIIEVSASLTEDRALGSVVKDVKQKLATLKLPAGYFMYFGGTDEALTQGRLLTSVLLGLALFLVYVVMAVQYESLRNPTVILICVPFAMIGVAIGLLLTQIPLSVPVWLGVIMLVGIVVNNSIVLVEYIEISRRKGLPVIAAIIEAAGLRLRPILMTTLTTVFGMLPLAIGLGDGSEMLQPLAITIVSGLSFSMLVSLLLLPVIYSLVSGRFGGKSEME